MKTKRETWYAIGVVSDKLVRDLREQMRREKILSAFQRAQEVAEGDIGTAKEVERQPGGPPLHHEPAAITAERSSRKLNR